MDFFSPAILGLQVALDPINLLYCFIGTILGTLIGVLPGIGPAATIALLMPITFRMTAVQAVIMLAGIYYGAMYGGSSTSILVNIPGEASCVTTCFDGYQMTQKGRAGAALSISAIGSFIGGTTANLGLMLIAYPLAVVALKFGPPEYFGILCMGLLLVIYLSSKSIIKGLIMASFGMLLATVGIDVYTSDKRFVFGISEILDGIEVIPMVMGLFGISEVIINLEKKIRREFVTKTSLRELWPNSQEWADSRMPILRGSVLGFLLGVLPGGGSMLSNFLSYAIEKKVSKHPERFGTGVIEGVAGPETANNAAANASFIPLFVLGIPPNIVMALLIGTFMIHGLQPGPLIIKDHPDLFWGTVMSMYIGNIMCLIFNLPMIGLWVQLLRVPYKLLFPLIILFCTIGAYSINNSFFDVFLMLVFGLFGYCFRKLDFELGPLVLAFIICRMLEAALRASLIMSDGSFGIFFARPISAIALILLLVIIAFSAIPKWGAIRRKIAEEDQEGDKNLLQM